MSITDPEVLKAIQTVLEDIALPGKPSGELEYQIISDTVGGHYQVVVLGWRGMKRLHGIIVQIDLKEGLVWVQADNTDYGVAEELVRLGIPREQIVLGYVPPSVRKHMGFATGEGVKAA